MKWKMNEIGNQCYTCKHSKIKHGKAYLYENYVSMVSFYTDKYLKCKKKVKKRPMYDINGHYTCKYVKYDKEWYDVK